MAGFKQLKTWFFQLVAPVSRPDGSVGGVRLRKGDQPSQQTFENLLASTTFSKESSDRAKIYTGSTDLGTEQGLAVLATDAQAKVNTSQLGDRSLVLQPHQNNTVQNSTGDQDNIPNDIDNYVGDAISVAADATTTRNNYIVKLSSSFKNWLGAIINEIQSQIDSISGNYLPLSGTVPGSDLSGNVKVENDVSIYQDASSGLGAPIASYTPYTSSPFYGSYNYLRCYLKGSGTDSNPQTHAGISQSPNQLVLWAINSNNTRRSNITLIADTGINSEILATVDASGKGFGIHTFSGVAPVYLKTDLTTAVRTVQFQDRDGTIAYLDDITNGDKYNTTSITPNDIDYNSAKVFTVEGGLSWKKGNIVRAFQTSSTDNFMQGSVSSYSGTTLVIEVDTIRGSGTGISDWTITLGSSDYVHSGTTTFTSITFGLGGVDSATINSQEVYYTKGNGMVTLSFVIDYTSTSGFPSDLVQCIPPSFLTPGAIGLGTAVIGTQAIGGGVTNFPFVVLADHTGTPNIAITSGDFGNGIPSGSQKIRGSVTYKNL